MVFEDRTAEAGLEDRLGWWNAIAGGDFNGDGHMDYAVMNAGLNSKYHASPEEPSLLYYGDMDASGVDRIIEAKTHHAALLPVRGRSCSSAAMPLLAEKFPTFHDFASAELPEIYPPETLARAREYRATELASGILLNDGAGRFSWQALPRLFQVSPAFGVVATDFDGDGHTDLYAVQNLFTREPETGPLDGGLSQLLLGDGTGDFRLAPVRETGLLVPGDGKGLAFLALDDDPWPDAVVTQNDGPVLAFRNRGRKGRRVLAVRLVGPRGNPTAVGAQVRLMTSEGRQQTAEVYAGTGYLSQSSPTLYFGLGESSFSDPNPEAGRETGASPQVDSGSARIDVRWPDGRLSSHEVPAAGVGDEAGQRLVLSYPPRRRRPPAAGG